MTKRWIVIGYDNRDDTEDMERFDTYYDALDRAKEMAERNPDREVTVALAKTTVKVSEPKFTITNLSVM